MTIHEAVPFSEDVYKRLKSLADSSGKSLTDFISEAVLERIEDLEDAKRAEDIMRKIESGEHRTYTLEEVERELGLDD